MSSASVRILVVEDDFLIRMVLSEILEDQGFTVLQAETGDAALPLIDRDVALLVTDMQLPGELDGLGLVDAARQRWPTLPVIFTSGQAVGMVEQDQRTIAIGKPYQGAEICAAVRRMLAQAG